MTFPLLDRAPELISELIIPLLSARDVIALGRTCRELHSILLDKSNPESEFIWKRRIKQDLRFPVCVIPLFLSLPCLLQHLIDVNHPTEKALHVRMDGWSSIAGSVFPMYSELYNALCDPELVATTLALFESQSCQTDIAAVPPNVTCFLSSCYDTVFGVKLVMAD